MNTRLQYFKLPALIMLLGAIVLFLNSCGDDDEPQSLPTVTTSALSDITTTSAVGGGDVTDNGNADITAVGLVYSSAVANPTLADNKTELTGTKGAFTSSLDNLTSGTTYRVRAYATNKIGTAYGEVVNFTTGNEAPVVTNVTLTGDAEVNKDVTVTYAYSDAEGDTEEGTVFQWYVADDASGSGETVIDGATDATFTLAEQQADKFIRAGVTPKAMAGTATGIEVKTAFVEVGEATTVTFIYNGDEVTYGILTSPVTQRKWLDRNLGAPEVPNAFNDFANYGDLFQWGRWADGHQSILWTSATAGSGVNGVSTDEQSSTDDPDSDKFMAVPSLFPQDWRNPLNNDLWQGVDGANNPCPSGWRIPTRAEWIAENLGTLSESYSQMKITFTGIRSANSGNVLNADLIGAYWTSSKGDPALSEDMFSYYVGVNPGAPPDTGFNTSRARGMACRCIKD